MVVSVMTKSPEVMVALRWPCPYLGDHGSEVTMAVDHGHEVTMALR